MSNVGKGKSLKTEIIDWIKHIGVTLLIVWFVTKFMFAHTVIPTPSMLPTIQCNDHIMVNKIPMYYRDPQREEIIVFHGEEKDLAKRVIGLPGEIIDIHDGHTYINGELIEEDYLPEGVVTESVGDLTYPYKIPEGSYFVMGDNRENSYDSRYIGTIKRGQIHAIAKLRIWPLKSLGNIY